MAGSEIERQLHVIPGRVHARRPAPELQIFRRPPQQPGVVAKLSKPRVASIAKQSADLCRDMAVVDTKPPVARLLLADRADAVLARQHPVIVALG
jgi:hypothetical protein